MNHEYPQSNYDIAQRILTKSVVKAIRQGRTKLNDVIDAYMRVYGISRQRKTDLAHRCINILMALNDSKKDCKLCADKTMPPAGFALIVTCPNCGRTYAVELRNFGELYLGNAHNDENFDDEQHDSA